MRACKFGPFGNLGNTQLNQESNSNTHYTKNFTKNKKKTMMFEENDEEHFKNNNLSVFSNNPHHQENQQINNIFINDSTSKSVANNHQSDPYISIPTPNNFNMKLNSPSFAKSNKNEIIKSKLNLSKKKQNIISKPSKPIKENNKTSLTMNIDPFGTFSKFPSVEKLKESKIESPIKITNESPHLAAFDEVNIERPERNEELNRGSG